MPRDRSLCKPESARQARVGTKILVDTQRETVYVQPMKVRNLVRIHKLIFTDSYVTELGGYLPDNIYQMLNAFRRVTRKPLNMKP